MNSRIAHFASVAVMTLVALACAPGVVAAQQMSFSYYSDAALSSDGQTVYGWTGGYDNSTGCSHYDYQTYGEFYTPGGFTVSRPPGCLRTSARQPPTAISTSIPLAP